MIVQQLLDWYTAIVVGFVNIVPPLPDGFETALRLLAGGGQFLAPKVALLGIIVPFDVIGTCIQLWAGLWVWWASMVGLRVLIWLAGR